jgi:hypothetical protein
MGEVPTSSKETMAIVFIAESMKQGSCRAGCRSVEAKSPIVGAAHLTPAR